MRRDRIGRLARQSRPAADDWRVTLAHPPTLAEAEARYREWMKVLHPDKGGDIDRAVKLNAAIEAARKDMK